MQNFLTVKNAIFSRDAILASYKVFNYGFLHEIGLAFYNKKSLFSKKFKKVDFKPMLAW